MGNRIDQRNRHILAVLRPFVRSQRFRGTRSVVPSTLDLLRFNVKRVGNGGGRRRTSPFTEPCVRGTRNVNDELEKTRFSKSKKVSI